MGQGFLFAVTGLLQRVDQKKEGILKQHFKTSARKLKLVNRWVQQGNDLNIAYVTTGQQIESTGATVTKS